MYIFPSRLLDFSAGQDDFGNSCDSFFYGFPILHFVEDKEVESFLLSHVNLNFN